MRDSLQKFVCYTLDRESIATEIRSVLVNEEDLALDDDRLTDEICTEYAERYGDLMEEFAWEDGPRRQISFDSLVEMDFEFGKRLGLEVDDGSEEDEEDDTSAEGAIRHSIEGTGDRE